jgi:hypothetical protein
MTQPTYYVTPKDCTSRATYGVTKWAPPDSRILALTRTGRWVFRDIHPFVDKLEAARAMVAVLEKEATRGSVNWIT